LKVGNTTRSPRKREEIVVALRGLSGSLAPLVSAVKSQSEVDYLATKEAVVRAAQRLVDVLATPDEPGVKRYIAESAESAVAHRSVEESVMKFRV